MGFGLLNYRWVFSTGRFLQSAVASGTSNPQLGGLVIRTFQLPPPGVPHVWKDANEPQQRKVELWARNFLEFCRKWRLARHFWVLFTCRKFTTWDRRLYFPSEGRCAEDFFARKNSRASAGYQRPARLYFIGWTTKYTNNLNFAIKNVIHLLLQTENKSVKPVFSQISNMQLARIYLHTYVLDTYLYARWWSVRRTKPVTLLM